MEKLNILKSLIDELQNASDNKCGTSIIKLMDLTNLTYPEIRPILRQLFEDKFIKVRKGINGKLIFLNKQ